MSHFIGWDSQPYIDWCNKWAPGKFIAIDGKRTHYIEKGEGKPVILLHGFGSDSYTWHANIDALAAKFRVYAMDLWGCGYSTREPIDYSYSVYNQQLLNFMDGMSIERAFLIGQSMGGGTIVKFTTEHRERVKGIVLVCAAGMPYKPVLAQRIFALPGLGELMLSLTSDTIRKMMITKVYLYRKPLTSAYYRDLTWSQKIRGSNRSYLAIARRKFFHALSEQYHQLGQMEVPTLIVWGKHDKGISVKVGVEMHRVLKQSRLEIFQNSAHEPHDEEPDRFNSLALEFLQECLWCYRVTPAAVVYVGDNPEADISGSRQIGMRVVLLNQGEKALKPAFFRPRPLGSLRMGKIDNSLSAHYPRL